jgi:coenzyme PQQ precursor peptide PqqA
MRAQFASRCSAIDSKSDTAIDYQLNLKEFIMWTTPAATEMRFGFEVTMYVMNK